MAGGGQRKKATQLYLDNASAPTLHSAAHELVKICCTMGYLELIQYYCMFMNICMFFFVEDSIVISMYQCWKVELKVQASCIKSFDFHMMF